jgi:hypothetical protein
MSRVTQPTNNYVCNPSISPGEIPNVHKDFRVPRKRFRGANADNVGKLSRLISFCMYGIFIFYNIYNRLTTRLKITYADVTECSPGCTGRFVVNNHLSDLGTW